MTQQSTANKELQYLKGSGFLALAIGLFFLTDAVRIVYFQYNNHSEIINLILNVIEGLFLLFMVVVLFKNLGAFTNVASKTAWYGKFDDEYLNHTNMKGYQYAFNLAIITLFIGMFAGDIWPDETSVVSLHIFCKTVFAISLLGYSFPVLKSLYDETD